ncbi:MAG TPA: ATP-binding protein [Spirochaetota bacterium]|nr:ATP-binding protein [Spirochaetota bacterium]HOL56331.1 ATP-binding protein [Spirochaetota bacterium]HPP03552.1 ATP-binding protein [Spirochaetota bacterium]
MISSNFFNTLKKKIEKLDSSTLRNILFEVIEENDNLKKIFNSMSEGVIVIDNEKKVLFYNKMAIRLLDINQNIVILNNEIEKLINNEIILNNINTLLQNNGLNESIEIKTRYSTFISISLQPLIQEGKIIGNIISIKDITLQKENEKKLRQAESLAALTTFSAGIAHEIKNPLGAIAIHIQLIEKDLKDCKCKRAQEFEYSINVIKEEVERLTEILNNFLFTVRPLKPEFMLVNLKTFLDKFIEFIQPELKANNIKLEKNYSTLSDVWIDEKLFKQALLNLIQNSIAAIKAHNSNSEGKIEIDAYSQGNYVIIDIIDNGIGIPEEIQNKIFDPYFTTKNNGTGLGLTIVYKIIKEHNGYISFISKKGETIFSIKIPSYKIEQGLIEYNS